jgi:hypothetical protein
MKAITTALLNAQKEMSNPIKGSANPFFKSKYADLNAVREATIPILNTYGIVVLQPLAVFEGKNYVKTILLHESGESIESLTEIVYSKANDAQAQGSGITYARRYGLQSLVCVGADDDDGNKASNPESKEPVKQLLTPNHSNWNKVAEWLSKEGNTIGAIEKKYILPIDYRQELLTAATKLMDK